MGIEIEKNVGDICDLCVITPGIYKSNHGSFMEVFNERDLKTKGLDMKFVQDNQVLSVFGVLRGLHVNMNNPQGKIIRVINGLIYDVVVDLRKSSKTYMKYFSNELSGENRKQLYIPTEFAHGYLVLSEKANVLIKMTTHWIPNDEIGIAWNSKELGIKWPIDDRMKIILNEKDTNN